ncbi:MAG: hypothetical protein ACLQQ4_12525 [Bacteroidia bacterium]
MVRKKIKQRIFLSWLLLTFFVAGQVVVYSHHHHTHAAPLTQTSHSSSGQTISDTCPLCDAMNYNHMEITPQVCAQAAPLSYARFTSRSYSFISISLILSCGRAPPISNFSV